MGSFQLELILLGIGCFAAGILFGLIIVGNLFELERCPRCGRLKKLFQLCKCEKDI